MRHLESNQRNHSMQNNENQTKSFISPKSKSSFYDTNGEEIKPILVRKDSPFVAKLSGKPEILLKIEDNQISTPTRSSKSLSFSDRRKAFFAAKSANTQTTLSNSSKIQDVTSNNELTTSFCISIDEMLSNDSSDEIDSENSINKMQNNHNNKLSDLSSSSDDTSEDFNTDNSHYLSFFLSPAKSPNNNQKTSIRSPNYMLKQKEELSREIQTAKNSLHEVLSQNDSETEDYSDSENEQFQISKESKNETKQIDENELNRVNKMLDDLMAQAIEQEQLN